MKCQSEHAHIKQPLTCAINVMSGERNCVNHKLTLQHSEQLWQCKWCWWWSHRRRRIHYVEVPPAISMRNVIEFKIFERYLLSDIFHLIKENKYTMCYTTCLQNIKYKLIFLHSLCGKGTLYYFTENFMQDKTTENIDNWKLILFVYLISRLHILCWMTSPVFL